MAISPPTPQESKGKFVLMNTSASIHRASKAFFLDPFGYLLYLGLIGTIIGLLFGAEFSIELYAILTVLFLIKFCQFVYSDSSSIDDGL